MEAFRSPQDIYARHISSSRGYPVLTPEEPHFLSYQEEGLRIGDVGVVVPKDGHFFVFFNICLSEDQQSRSSGVPEGFSPIPLNEADIRTVHNVETPGRIIKSSSVARVGKDESPIAGDVLPIDSLSSKAVYDFELSPTEGALLILPEGADSHDVRDPRPFFEQASRHATTWHRFAEKKLPQIVGHDSLYVVTGFHKARSWSIGAYENAEGSARLTVEAGEGASVASRCKWDVQFMDMNVGPNVDSSIANQTVFVRGFKIALRSDVQGVPQSWVSYQQRHRSNDSWLANTLKGISRTIGLSSDDAEEGAGYARIEISSIPQFLPVYHPSDVVNRYLLQNEPSADVAITHDSTWGSLLNKNLLKPEALLHDELLTKAMRETYKTVSRGGVAYLQNKDGSDAFADAIKDDFPATEVASCTLVDGVCDPDAKAENKVVNAGSLSVVSESNYRCIDDTAAKSIAPQSQSAGLHGFASKFAASGAEAPTTPGSKRLIKIIVISDYICAFCYICDKVIHDALKACMDLPVCFDVEYRPFTLVNPSALPRDQVVWRNLYVMKKFGKEQAEIKLMAVNELSQKTGLKLADDSIVSVTTQVHRLAAKAYKDGGQELQRKFNTFIFDACLAKKANLGDEAVLVDAAVSTGLVNEEEEATAFLRSTEHQACVEKTVEAARAQGINGVPFVIIDGKWAVNGLQPVECFIQIFRKLALSHTPTVMGKTETEREEAHACQLPS